MRHCCKGAKLYKHDYNAAKVESQSPLQCLSKYTSFNNCPQQQNSTLSQAFNVSFQHGAIGRRQLVFGRHFGSGKETQLRHFTCLRRKLSGITAAKVNNINI